MPLNLVWCDNFDQRQTIDASCWSFETGYVRNNERQYYTQSRPQNCRILNNQLVIEARREAYRGYGYTSASVTTKNKKSFLYGRLVIRAKFPTGRGIWPAIWTLGCNIDSVGWPMCGEIDVMENVGYDPLRVHANIHTGAFNHETESNLGSSIILNNPTTTFHDYSIEWSDTKIEFFVDEHKYFTFQKDKDYSAAQWPFDEPHYLILNLAVGGFWGGKEGVDDTIFPQQFVIDSVKYYQ